MSDYTNAQFLTGIAAGNVYTYRGRELRVSGDVPSDAQIAIDAALDAAGGVPTLGAANIFQQPQTITTSDAGTTTVVTGLAVAHNTSGTAAAGLGSGLHLQAKDTTTPSVDQGAVQTSWVDATHATRKARLALVAYDTAAREGVRVEASGTAPTIGFYGHSAVAQQAAAAVATDADTTLALANSLRAILVALGLAS